MTNDTAPSCRIDIDVIDANARTANHTQPRRRIQNCTRHFCLTTNDNRTEIRNDFDEISFA